MSLDPEILDRELLHAEIIQMIRNNVIEECAVVAELYDSEALSWTEDGRTVIQSAVADAIRALKASSPSR